MTSTITLPTATSIGVPGGRGRALVLTLLAAATVAACGSGVHLPPDSASPAVVLDTYLAALVAGDCATDHALALPTFVVGNGELCGALHVSAFTPLTAPATPSDGVVEFATTLTTSGGDQSMPDGEHIWFYELDRQPSGAWRIAGGGSGP